MEMKNKKGSIEDLIFMIITLLGLALFIIIIFYTIPQVTDGLLETEMGDVEAIQDVFGESDRIMARLDPIYLIIFAGLIMSIFIISFMMHSHVIFVPVYIILMGITIAVGAITNHVYNEFAANTNLAAAAASQTYMVAIMDHFLIIMLGVGIISMIIIFAKPFQSTRV